MDIELPDGTVITDIPEGTTKAQLVSKLQAGGMTVPQEWISQVEQKQESPSYLERSVLNPLFKYVSRPIVGAGEAAMQLGTGLASSALGGISGLYSGATGTEGQEVADEIRSAQKAFTYQPRTAQGQTASQIVNAPMEYGSKALGYAGGKAGGMFGEQGRVAGESLGEAALPIAATIMMGKAPVKSIATTKFVKPTMPDIPIVSDFAAGLRDVVRTRSGEKGIKKLAEEVVAKSVPEAEIGKIIKAVDTRYQEVVPGSPVTTADAIARANRQAELLGRPERFGGSLVALEEALGKTKETSSQANTIRMLREKAREDVLNKGAGSKVLYEAYEAIRTKNAKAYDKIGQAVVETDKNINMLMTRPSMQKALSVAEEVAAERGKPLVIGKDIPEQIIHSSILDASGKPVSQTIIPAQYAKFPIETLQSIKMALDKMVAKPKDYGIEAMQMRDVVNTRSQLVDWLSTKSEAYKRANAQYAIDSLPLNRMDLWSRLKEKMISPTEKETPGSYLAALRNEQKLIKEATGYQKGSSVGDIFNAKESALANRLAAELEMELYKQRMGKEVTLQGATKPASNLEPQLPNLLMRESMIANYLLKTLAKDANMPVNIAVQQILADPKMVSSILKQIKPKHRSGVLKAMRNSTLATATGIQSQQELEQ